MFSKCDDLIRDRFWHHQLQYMTKEKHNSIESICEIAYLKKNEVDVKFYLQNFGSLMTGQCKTLTMILLTEAEQ